MDVRWVRDIIGSSELLLSRLVELPGAGKWQKGGGILEAREDGTEDCDMHWDEADRGAEEEREGEERNEDEVEEEERDEDNVEEEEQEEEDDPEEEKEEPEKEVVGEEQKAECDSEGESKEIIAEYGLVSSCVDCIVVGSNSNWPIAELSLFL